MQRSILAVISTRTPPTHKRLVPSSQMPLSLSLIQARLCSCLLTEAQNLLCRSDVERSLQLFPRFLHVSFIKYCIRHVWTHTTPRITHTHTPCASDSKQYTNTGKSSFRSWPSATRLALYSGSGPSQKLCDLFNNSMHPNPDFNETVTVKAIKRMRINSFFNIVSSSSLVLSSLFAFFGLK